MTSERLSNDVARLRAEQRLTQQDLASRVGLSRQALSAIETGHSIPSAALALRLAAALGQRVDDVFRLEGSEAVLEAELSDSSGCAANGSRVTLASVFGKRVAHVLVPDSALATVVAADGLLCDAPASGWRDGMPSRVKPLVDAQLVEHTLVCAGCSPALGVLTARASAGRDARILWLEASSESALELLRTGRVHVAGAHLFDESSGQYNVPFARRAMPDRALSIVELARWEVGLVTLKGNPRRIQRVQDLARRRLRVAARELGSGAQQLLHRELAAAGIPPDSVLAAAHARSHLGVARAVALGAADAGIAIPSVARALGLEFVPLATERFDLIYDDRLDDDPRLARLMNVLTGAAFSEELKSMGGYDLCDAGKLVARTRVA